jgi:hypothetical protein
MRNIQPNGRLDLRRKARFWNAYLGLHGPETPGKVADLDNPGTESVKKGLFRGKGGKAK